MNLAVGVPAPARLGRVTVGAGDLVPHMGQRCPECGAPASPRSCDGLFQELLALDHSRRAPWGPLHGIAVACFFLQHSSRLYLRHSSRLYLRHSSRLPGTLPGTACPLYWALLHAYLRGGLAAAASMTERVRQLNSHRHGGRAPRAGDYPGAPPFPGIAPPPDYGTTIADVALDGTFPAAGYEDRVRSWASHTLSAWQAAT